MFWTVHTLQLKKTLKKHKVVEFAHANGVSVEAEVGTIGGEEDGIIGVMVNWHQSKMLKLWLQLVSTSCSQHPRSYPEN